MWCSKGGETELERVNNLYWARKQLHDSPQKPQQSSAYVCSVQHPRCMDTPVHRVLHLYVSSACIGNSCDWELLSMATVLQGMRPALLHPLWALLSLQQKEGRA